MKDKIAIAERKSKIIYSISLCIVLFVIVRSVLWFGQTIKALFMESNYPGRIYIGIDPPPYDILLLCALFYLAAILYRDNIKILKSLGERIKALE